MQMRLEDFPDETCLWCGGEIDMDQPHANKRLYCGSKCRNAHHNELRKQGEHCDRLALNRNCRLCELPVPTERDRRAIYCSHRCKKLTMQRAYRVRQRNLVEIGRKAIAQSRFHCQEITT